MQARASREPDMIDRCYHCAESLPAGSVVYARLGDAQQAMCCVGCKSVAEFIHANGMSAFYSHRTAPAADPGQRPDDSDWSIYDQPQLLTRYVSSDGSHAVATIEIAGMYCAACSWLFDSAMRRLDGIGPVAHNSATHRAVIRWDESRLRFSEVLAAIARIGFRPLPTSAGLAIDNSAEQRVALRRLVVAAAAGMQVMM
jgi:Cu2+-exporting ATPase